ncbi:exostosin-like 2 [Moschus berezovskii]|uniref:exostosin-like 2 n=1 Tax=Bubalus bubalis TaxID=89462 RepID=UPI00042CA8BF|nr:exostosin-like 2 [Bubalus bubalis]XP_006049878.1 exostosin-like 2 [Bubalus bubalis]XP_044800570.1 exostosin-like 2 [Bubalus bubalis]XP_055259245.1 exostosin-like 2 [Moschus berezovskii]XP_055259246.1 exostosin-like 2 [Moschus berezovskii]XP_055440926.1 exostosin-like 2 [Bubalus carabanensis]XP_055440927.1 exostosin-like 2 [Bubalus carabanensis]XP_055440928.1 exostosin-like 2 [Bubalus carabanensis]
MRCCHICKLPGRVMGIRVLRLSLVVILVLLLVAGALTTLLPNIKEDKMLTLRREIKSQGKPTQDSFTLIMQTYNRTDLLLRLLNHYQAVPYLHKVIVVWNNVGEKGPEELWNSLGPHPVPVNFKAQTTNRMRNRLQVFPELETKAVLMVDDDLLISAQDLVFAFSVWQQFPDQIVGFVPRKHVSTSSGIYSYGGFELQTPGFGNGDHYSLVLIGASFFHSKYLELFQRQPAAVHALLDETQNCDDIAMNFIIAKHTGKTSGVFVKPVNIANLEKETTGGYSGMWHRAEHFLQRSYCINKLVNIYDSMPLKYSNIMISQFGFPYANHKSKM